MGKKLIGLKKKITQFSMGKKLVGKLLNDMTLYSVLFFLQIEFEGLEQFWASWMSTSLLLKKTGRDSLLHCSLPAGGSKPWWLLRQVKSNLVIHSWPLGNSFETTLAQFFPYSKPCDRVTNKTRPFRSLALFFRLSETTWTKNWREGKSI